MSATPLAVGADVAMEVTMEISSAAFAEEESIPARYTCDGPDVSPPLRITGVPEGTKGVALISDDPDAPGGTWVHWVVYGIPPDVEELPEGYSTSLSDGAAHGVNGFGRRDYGGPCPPPGSPHTYFFKAYAVGTEIGKGPGTTKTDLLREMEGSILATAQLTGTYKRR